MLHSDGGQAVTVEQILNELQRPEPQVVQPFDLSVESLPDLYNTFRKQDSLAATHQAFNRLNDLFDQHGHSHTHVHEHFVTDSTPNPIKEAVNAHVRDELIKLAEKLEDPALKAKFTNPELTEKDRLEVLNYVTSDELVKFIGDLYKVSLTNPTLRDFITHKIDNALFYASMGEKADIIEKVLQERPTEARNKFIAAVCRSSENLSELTEIVHQVSAEKLLATGAAEIKEMVAHTVLDPQIQTVQFPQKLPLNATQEQIDKHIAEMKTALEKIIDICNTSSFSRTQIATDYVETARDDLAQIDKDKSEFENRTRELAKALNVSVDIVALEYRYGINITYGEGENLISTNPASSRNPHWTEKDIADIKAIVENIPERSMLFTPLLKEVQRVPFLGWGVLGARFEEGVIKIADVAIDHRGMQQAYEGISSLRIVLVHEMGHSIQLGNFPSDIHFGPNGTSIDGGDPLYDFQDFIDLSGWKVIERSRYKVVPGRGFADPKIRLDGTEYPIGEPIDVDGRKIVLVYQEGDNILYSYNADARFSSRWYAKASPWEDFAEAFAEYIFLPKRLIHDAPEKFKHLEQEFKKYSGNQEIQAALESALRGGR